MKRHVRKYTQFLLPSAGDEFRLVENFSFISDFTAELNFVTALQINIFPREILLHATECEFVIPHNYLKPEVIEIVLKMSVSTLQKTPILHYENSSK
jgi:hypothetical protein